MPNPSPLVGVIVLNYNGKDCLSACLFSLQNLDYQRFFIVVVDNGSTDGSIESVRGKFPQCTFVELKENLGFAGGMNRGISAALSRGAEFVWLFNNDAKAEPQALMRLVEAAQKEPKARVLSPWILDEQTGSLWFGKAKINWFRMRMEHMAPSESERAAPRYSSACLTGCALFISRDLLEKIGSFDERFFLYYEDADFSMRTKNAGFKMTVVPSALVFHAEQSQNNPEKLFFLVRSGLLFFQKHATWWQRPYFLLYGTIRRIKNYFDILRGKDTAPVVRRAYDSFYHG